MWRLFCRARRCGRRARDRCRPSPGRAGGGERRGCAATRSTSRSRSRRGRSACPRRRGPRAVSLSLANHAASLPVSYRLYLPRDWAEDPARRAKAGVPEEIAFRTKPEIALDQLRAAAEAGLPRGVAVMDAAYGKDTGFRTGVSALGLG